jgi:very-short-patch-repair endonuclease/DNA polymerase III delta prime subunit
MGEPGLVELGNDQRTADVRSWSLTGRRVEVTFKSGRKYGYALTNVTILEPGRKVDLSRQRITIDGKLVDATRVVPFGGKSPSWYRVYQDDEPQGVPIRAGRVEFLSRSGAEILSYFRAAVDLLPGQGGRPDPLRRIYSKYLRFHPGSALHAYLAAEVPAAARPRARRKRPIFPFETNLSQRAAVRAALRHPVSIIGGPPGTGKTQTILNLVANIVGPGEGTVAVVAFNNQAVLNVAEKLADRGYAALIADLRRAEYRESFFAAEHPKPEFRATPYSSWRLAWLDRRLARLSRVERQKAVLTQERADLALERQHFDSGHSGEVGEAPRPTGLEYRSSRAIRRILQAIRPDVRSGVFAGLASALRQIRSGQLKYRIDGGSDLVRALERLWYARRQAELDAEIDQLQQRLGTGGDSDPREEYQLLSRQVFDSVLSRRYARCANARFSQHDLEHQFAAFTKRFPVLISTCHSLPSVVPPGQLVDYLIIDEASQLDLLTAAPALACARRVVVVGDDKQLPHVASQDVMDALAAPFDAYDYGKHSLLTSVREVFGGRVPETLLREHYRCDPEIIGFCNTQYYDGQLIVLTPPHPSSSPLQMRVPPPGNHMRAHLGGGLSNQREIDVIRQEVLPDLDEPADCIGLATPYRRQVEKLSSAVGGAIETDTIHKFQGREKPVIIMSAVVDGSGRGASQLEAFVDDPHLINVAVSRAQRRFILVADRAAIDHGVHLRDLARYIRHHTVGDGEPESRVISVFDLLYKSHSPQLDALGRRLRGQLHFKSEDIIWTALQDFFSEPTYSGFDSCHEYFVRNLVRDGAALSEQERAYVRNGARVDFVVYRKIDKRVAFAVEVDGFDFHENNPRQIRKDLLKDSILAKVGVRLIRLSTTGSGELEQLREALDDACDDPV